MRQRTTIVDGKRLDLSAAEKIYADGRFGSRGTTLYQTKKGNLVIENWTNWQGEDNSYELTSPEDALAWLLKQRHPDRVAAASEALGLVLEEA